MIIAAAILGALGLGGDDSGNSGNAAPSVVIGSISRTDGQVAVPITAVDAEGDPVSLTVEYDSGGGFTPATVAPTSVSASAAGVAHVLNWDAPTDLGGTAFVGGIVIRITPDDGSATGTAVTSDPFDFGNDAPVVTVVSVDTDAGGKVAGDAIVRFTVTDSSSDSISITAFEYSELGDFSDAVDVPLTTGVGNNFPSGSLSNLTSSPGGVNHSFTWDSFLTAPVSASGVRIRLKLGDPLGGDSGFVQSQAFDLANSTFVTITNPIARTTGQVQIPVTVFNTSDLMVTLTVEYDTGSGFQPASTTPAQIQGTSAGNPGVIQWDAPTDLGGTAFEGNVVVRITPDDGLSTGPQETSDPFEFGNDAPVVTILSVDTDGGVAGGNIIVRFTVTDTASDVIELTKFEFSLAGDFSDTTDVPLTTGQAGNFPGGSLVNLLTDPAGIEHSFAWNSELTAPVDNAGTRVRLKVQDSFMDESAFQQSQAFELDNATPNPPIAQIVAVKRPDGGGLRSGAVAIDYRLLDADGDACDVVVEYSTNGKASWNVASEYPSPVSESRYDLVSEAKTGVRHRFVWDAAADLAQEEPSVHIRITPAAQDGVGLAAETSIDISVGADPGVPVLSGVTGLTAESGTNFVATADLNRDGHLDLVAVNTTAGTLSVFIGRGNGAFSSPTSISVDPDPRQLAIADLTGDDVLDLVVTIFAGGKLQLLTGNGDGTFASPTDINTGGEGGDPYGVVAADFDNDGTLDLGVSASANKRLVFLKGNGDGSFNAPTVTNLDTDPRGINVGDLNEDGNLDVVIACAGSSTVNVLIGDGAGNFTKSKADVNDDPRDAVLGYFNGDSHLDMAAVNTKVDKQELSVFIGNGDGTFQNDVIHDAGQLEPRTLVTADFTNDGVLDLAIVNSSSSLVLLVGNGDGTFAAPISFITGAAMEDLAAGDFNEDGILDLVVARSTGRLSILTGRREGDSWFRDMTDFGGGGNTVGATTAPGGNDLHGLPRVNRFGQRLWHGHSELAADDLRRGDEVATHDFLQLLQQAGISPAPPIVEPLTRAWTASGDIRLLRVTDPGPTNTGYRIQPMSRFGDRLAPASQSDMTRAGLDLSDASFANQRGIVVDLPIIGSRSDAEINSALTAGRIHVYLRTTDWLRASDFPADPINGFAGQDDYLPRIDAGGGNYRDLVIERHTWAKVSPAPSNDLTQGTGPRFAVDLAPGNRRIRVLLDRGGSLQGYFEQP